MFHGAESFNQDIHSWDVSESTTFWGMFWSATSFNQDISSWDVSTSTRFNSMFRSATSFNQDISSWNVSASTSFYNMFNNATSFHQDLCTWDISSDADTDGFCDMGASCGNYSGNCRQEIKNDSNNVHVLCYYFMFVIAYYSLFL